MKKRKISQELLNLLGAGRWNDFTVSELKSTYMALPGCPHRTDKAAWQFVYRHVQRMETQGLLRRLAERPGEKARYRLSEPTDTVAISPQSRASHEDLHEDATLRCLREKLHSYKEEMLSVIGETEEYDAICTQLPHLKNAVQALYNDARERCSKTLGRVKALESILSNHLAAQHI
ncbi:MAG: hypothetical protein QM709_12245 [Spongiibacteraceae bacterium]